MSNARTVTHSDIKEAVGEAIQRRGDSYIYPAVIEIEDYDSRMCRYWHDEEGEEDGPGCIVGVVFHGLGATREQLKDCEESGALAVIERLQRDGWVFPDFQDTWGYLADIQAAQDNGATWGFARRNAEELESLRKRLVGASV